MVFVTVVLLRLGIPLLIPRFPLPAILAALVIDAADQTIFQQLTDLDLEGYQGYDKALDVYYLAIAYLATIRNWRDPFAFKVAQFLWYYRLVGVVLFELTDARAVLLLFPNTFEYFFIAYEAVRTRWNPLRLSRRAVLGLAAFIWVFIKLPQEWWIHVAQLDFTDFMKEDVLGVTVTTSWGSALSQNLWFVALMIVLVVVVVVGARAILERAPDADWRFTLDVDAHLPPADVSDGVRPAPTFSWYTAEKAALMGLLWIIFSEVIPSSDAAAWQTALSVGVIVLANAALTQWLVRSWRLDWTSLARHFASTLTLNLLLVVGYLLLLRSNDNETNDAATLFFILLLTLVVTLFDRFRLIRTVRTDAEVEHS
ncbi:MAG: hypothetical protein AAGF73_02355 [Actinomycetota bacterium]